MRDIGGTESEADIARSAARGDGFALAEYLRRSRHAVEWLAPVAPRIATGKQAVTTWVRHGASDRSAGVLSSVHRYVTYRQERLRIAEALGDAAMAGEERAILDRYREALSRREVSIVLAVLDRM